MTSSAQNILEASIDIDATPAKVWALVANPRNMTRWSPDLAKVFMRGPAQQGSSTLNINRMGAMVWPTRSQVVAFDPPREYAIRIKENKAVWSFTLEPTDTGTRLIQRRDTSAGTTALSQFAIKRFLGGQRKFSEHLVRGMAETLRKIKVDVEAR